MSETFRGFDGAALALERVGEGRPLILLHGLFSDAKMNWIKFGHAAVIEWLNPAVATAGDYEARQAWSSSA